MKTIIKISAVIIAAVLCTAIFAACGNESKDDKSSASGSSAVDTTEKKDGVSKASGEPVSKSFSWVKFDVPAGYIAEEAEDKVIAVNENDKNMEVTVAREVLQMPNQGIDEIVEQQVAVDSSKYSQGGNVGFGDRMWKMVKYQDDGVEKRMFFALAGDGTNYLKVSTSGLTENSDDVRTVLASLTVL